MTRKRKEAIREAIKGGKGPGNTVLFFPQGFNEAVGSLKQNGGKETQAIKQGENSTPKLTYTGQKRSHE
jgi:hypothetical protein